MPALGSHYCAVLMSASGMALGDGRAGDRHRVACRKSILEPFVECSSIASRSCARRAFGRVPRRTPAWSPAAATVSSAAMAACRISFAFAIAFSRLRDPALSWGHITVTTSSPSPMNSTVNPERPALSAVTCRPTMRIGPLLPWAVPKGRGRVGRLGRGGNEIGVCFQGSVEAGFCSDRGQIYGPLKGAWKP